MLATTVTRRCTGCLQEKPLSDFYKMTRGPGGLNHRCKSCVRAWPSAQKPRRYDRATRYRLQYGLTPEALAKMSAAQGYVCAICKRDRELCVDHDHQTRWVRGLLCRQCNSAIGLLGDTREGVRRALEYLS